LERSYSLEQLDYSIFLQKREGAGDKARKYKAIGMHGNLFLSININRKISQG
jgi:hypothetical protein